MELYSGAYRLSVAACFCATQMAAQQRGLEHHSLLHVHLFPAALCNPRTNAGAHVKAQDLQPQSPGLPQDLPLPKVATDGCSTW